MLVENLNQKLLADYKKLVKLAIVGRYDEMKLLINAAIKELEGMRDVTNEGESRNDTV